MDTLNQLADIVQYLEKNIPWDVVVASGVISPLLLAVKKWRITKNVESLFTKDWFVFTVLALMSAATVAGQYLMTTPTNDPSILAFRTAVLVFTSQSFYMFILKPISKWLARQVTAAAELKLAQSVTVQQPAAPAPITDVVAPKAVIVDDFSH